MQRQSTPSNPYTKVCPKCGEAKLYTSAFFSQKGGGQLRATCKACISRQMSAYYKQNAERLRAASVRNRRQNPEYMRAYRQRYRARNRGLLLRKNQAYNAANRERARSWFRLAAGRRRARIRCAEGTHTAADIRAQYARQKGCCYYCHKRVGDAYHVDHVVPLSRGGSNGAENLVIACPSCNVSKQDRLPHEWPQGGRLL